MKRLVAFVVLLVIGFVALRLSIGDEDVVAGNVGRAQAPTPSTPAGVEVQRDARGVTIAHTGHFSFQKTRTLPAVDGRARIETVYTVSTADSHGLGSGQQQLDGVDVVIFDKGTPAAKLACERAFVTLRQDANGKPSIDEGKDLDLRNSVLESLPGSRLGRLRLELANARVRIEDDSIVLTTPADEPVTLNFDGGQAMALHGRGAQALLPRSADGALRRADVEILREPVLDSEGIHVQAAGRLHFVDDLDAGVGTVTINDAVTMELANIDLQLPGGTQRDVADRRGKATVQGDQFVGWLVRGGYRDAEGNDHQRVDWRQLVLTGAPATLVVPGSRLTTPRVTVLPGLFGSPMLLTAHGGASRLEQTTLRRGQKATEPVVGTSSRRLHCVMPKEQLGALHRAFGFPRWSMPAVERLQVVVVEGTAHIEQGTASYEASDGVRLYRLEDSEVGIGRGFGRVRVEQRATKRGQQDLVATGSDGFVLRSTARGGELQLGPPMPLHPDAPGSWRQHEFAVDYGDMVMRGRGVGVVRRVDERVTVDFLAADTRMTAKVPSKGLDLQRVGRVQAEFEDGLPVAFDVGGSPLAVAIAGRRNTVLANSPRIVQIGPHSLRLLPADPKHPAHWSGLVDGDRLPRLQGSGVFGQASLTQQIDVHGPQIDVHHVGGEAVLVDAAAVGDVLPTVYAKVVTGAGREPTTIACTAERLRVLPFLLSPEIRMWMSANAGGAVSLLAFHHLRSPWLVVDRVRDFQLDDPEQGHVEGRGRTLLVGNDGRAALFVGDPDEPRPAEVVRTRDGRITTMRGARVRLFDNGGSCLQAVGSFADRSTFLAPTLALRDPQSNGLLANMQAICRGNIDVLPDEVLFGGPVLARGLSANGDIDPDGIAIDAQQLHLARKHGEIKTAVGQNVVVDWTRLHATCAKIELHVDQQRLVATDPDEARVVLGDGRELLSPRIEVDYRTLAFAGSAVQVIWPAPVARKK